MFELLGFLGMISLASCYFNSPDLLLPASIFIGCYLIAYAIKDSKKH